MMTAKLITSNGSQAVLLPEGCRLDGDEAYVNRIGDAVVLTPKNNDMFTSMLASAGLFTDDFMEGVEDLPLQERKDAL
ncbi:MAG TPA: AbrB/MazE/SpoVT family DNA-binding domain-containing protein [Eggerthellaceae bacterium]|nr:AbrB/MazE/SpoVT family DNA-binding domain-containing protein [Eggerthellaceae bacterium]